MSCQTCGRNNSKDSRFCTGCGNSLNAPTSSGALAIKDNSIRYHGLDALRGMAMLLGIVLHAALPYMPNIEAFWPADESSSHLINTIFQFIHIWRMPLFFMLAGFFANLYITKRSWEGWWGNRLLRIGLPIVLFWPLISLTLPWIYQYGKTGELIFFYSDTGQPHHLWFLWHLMIFVILTAILRPLYLLCTRIFGDVFGKSKSTISGILFRSRFPIVFIILCCVINISTGGELILNPVASLLYFAFGYSLYGNTSLFTFLKANWRYYFLAGFIGFILYMILSWQAELNVTESRNFTKEIYELFDLLKYLLKIICAVLFSYAFIGLAEKRFGSYNAKLRFISDGAYWMYLIHLPIVAFITFSMFDLHMPIEIKFLIAISLTSLICLGTYKYFVRSTPISLLLNGKRHVFNIRGL